MINIKFFFKRTHYQKEAYEHFFNRYEIYQLLCSRCILKGYENISTAFSLVKWQTVFLEHGLTSTGWKKSSKVILPSNLFLKRQKLYVLQIKLSFLNNRKVEGKIVIPNNIRLWGFTKISIHSGKGSISNLIQIFYPFRKSKWVH